MISSVGGWEPKSHILSTLHLCIFCPWQTIKFCKCTKRTCSQGTLSRTCFPAGSPRYPPWCCRCTTRTWSMWTGRTSLCSCGKDGKARGTWGARHYMCKFCARHQCWEGQRRESCICNFLTNRHALLADDPRRRNTASAGAQKHYFCSYFDLLPIENLIG